MKCAFVYLAGLAVAALIPAALHAGTAGPAAEPPGARHTFNEDSTVERPFYYERAVTEADLDGRTLRELSILRNWVFARAGNRFRRAWLNEFFSTQAWYSPRAAMADSAITDLDRKNAAFIARYQAAIPWDVLEDHWQRLSDLSDPTPEDRLEHRLITESLGNWTPEGGRAHPSPLEDTARLDSLLTLEELNDLSRRDLALLRNLIYARRHRPFVSRDLELHFKRYAWYAPDSTYSDDRLTSIDRRNINLIHSLEEEVGGPIDLEDGDVWFGEA